MLINAGASNITGSKIADAAATARTGACLVGRPAVSGHWLSGARCSLQRKRRRQPSLLGRWRPLTGCPRRGPLIPPCRIHKCFRLRVGSRSSNSLTIRFLQLLPGCAPLFPEVGCQPLNLRNMSGLGLSQSALRFLHISPGGRLLLQLIERSAVTHHDRRHGLGTLGIRAHRKARAARTAHAAPTAASACQSGAGTAGAAGILK